MNLVKQVKFYLKGTILAVSNKDNTILDKLDETVVKIKRNVGGKYYVFKNN